MSNLLVATNMMLPHFELHADLKTLAAWADVPVESISVPQREDVHESHHWYPVLRLIDARSRRISWMREGLIPSYAYDDHDSMDRVEAHAESMTCDTCFRAAFRRRRCIVPAQAVHVVRHLSAEISHPCSFSLESGKIFGLAAVWETWINDEGHSIESFATVTARVTPLLRSLFDRMPVILSSKKERERWLSSGNPDSTPLNLLTPLSPCQLKDWKMVPSAVKMHLRSEVQQ